MAGRWIHLECCSSWLPAWWLCIGYRYSSGLFCFSHSTVLSISKNISKPKFAHKVPQIQKNVCTFKWKVVYCQPGEAEYVSVWVLTNYCSRLALFRKMRGEEFHGASHFPHSASPAVSMCMLICLVTRDCENDISRVLRSDHVLLCQCSDFM